ncbi:N-acetyl-beta-hexosaminidase [Dysgonomonadaceae bacterium PH5-43]|nr:N-acetyl-beta-hexosaminidase [Dysgonomonadaceae bacterium PH5-43]
MKKIAFLFMCFILSLGYAEAQTMPSLSDGDNEYYYFIRYPQTNANGNYVITAANDEGTHLSSMVSYRTAIKNKQLWKFVDAGNGFFKIVNTDGRQIMFTPNVGPNSKGRFFAVANNTNDTKFKLEAYTGAAVTGGSNGVLRVYNGDTMYGHVNQDEATGEIVSHVNNGGKNNAIRFDAKGTEVDVETSVNVIPYPASLVLADNKTILVNSLKAITYPTGDDTTKTLLEGFAEQLNKTSGVNLEVKAADTSAQDNISFILDNAIDENGYALDVTEEGVTVKASQPVGFFYAVQTLKQLLPREFFGQALVASDDWKLPCLSITDKPNLDYRGYMLDEARYFFGKEEVKKILDIMSLYKLNRLHWHLTDDQGWRVEIPEYPLLTEVGSVRSGSLVSTGVTKFFDDTEYGEGLWYSLDDLREIVAYAKARHIEIIPEVDFPGHMVAAITAYPEFSCDPTKKYSVRLDNGISQDVLNVGDDKVIDFLKTVLGHIAEVFPYEYIHFGGDECPTTQWSTNADCLKRVKDENLTGVNQLQSWLVELLGKYVKEEYNKDIIVWDEVISSWKTDNEINPVIMAWTPNDKSGAAADKGFKTIYSSYTNLYFSKMQVTGDKADVNEPYQGGGTDYTVTVQSVYNANPFGALAGREEYCMGIQGNMWTETTSSIAQLEYQLLPRLLALAENGWLPTAQKNWGSFYERLQTHDEIFDALDFVYAKHYIDPEDLTASETALAEANSIIEASIRGGVGYPSVEIYDALVAAYDNLKANKDDDALLTALTSAMDNYKYAKINMPEAGKIYQIVSASTYYRQRYAGSAMYEKDNTISFHYTPQVEPEELWQFVPNGEGFVIKNHKSGKRVSLPTYNDKAVLDANNATVVRVDKAALQAGNYTYIPGTVTISELEGYSGTPMGYIKRMYADGSGLVKAIDDPKLCYPGTWYIIEVTDFRVQLEGLLRKSENIIVKTEVGLVGSPTQAALDFLETTLVTPLKSFLNGNALVSEDSYNEYLAIYNEYLSMPCTSVFDVLSEKNYYYIRSAYFTKYYAKANTETGDVEPARLAETDDHLRWNFKKNTDGTVYIYNKATEKATFVSSSAINQGVKINYANTGIAKWTVKQITTDLGGTGIVIMEPGCAYGWYTNPDSYSFTNVLLKPYDWGASIWVFEMLEDDEVITNIESVMVEENNDDTMYDVLGRPVKNPTKGFYIQKGKKVYLIGD